MPDLTLPLMPLNAAFADHVGHLAVIERTNNRTGATSRTVAKIDRITKATVFVGLYRYRRSDGAYVTTGTGMRYSTEKLRGFHPGETPDTIRAAAAQAAAERDQAITEKRQRKAALRAERLAPYGDVMALVTPVPGAPFPLHQLSWTAPDGQQLWVTFSVRESAIEDWDPVTDAAIQVPQFTLSVTGYRQENGFLSTVSYVTAGGSLREAVENAMLI